MDKEWGTMLAAGHETHLLFILCLSGRAVMSFLKQELLHFAILKIVQLPHGIFRPIDEINQHRLWSFALDKCVLREGRGKDKSMAELPLRHVAHLCIHL